MGGGSLAAKVEVVVTFDEFECMHIHHLKAFVPTFLEHIHNRFKLHYLLRSLVLLAAAAAEHLLALSSWRPVPIPESLKVLVPCDVSSCSSSSSSAFTAVLVANGWISADGMTRS